MRQIAVAVLSILTAILSVHSALARADSECLLSLSATADNATTSRNGRMVAAVAGSSGACTFTVTACINDANVPACTPGTVNKLRLLGSRKSTDATALQEQLQAQLPSSQRTCTQATVSVGQTLHQRIRLAVGTDDHRIDVDSLILACRCPSGTETYSSTFQLIQKSIFEKYDCANSACHGSAKQGGLDLSPNVAYENLVEVPSTESSFNRVQPGDKERSFLWLKLVAKTDPSLLPPGIAIAGAPMPNNPSMLTADEIEALRLWIYTGAPQNGTVPGADALLNANACLPPQRPHIIKPLDPPPLDEHGQPTGIQFVMPPWHLEAHSEHEICFATYYDISAQVPRQFQDPSGTLFRFSRNVLRQDPQSHHLILNRYIGSAADIHDPSFGTWTCNGGDKAGQTCEPTDLASCGTGTCTSEIQQSFACVGFGPQTGGFSYYAIGGAQQSQSDSTFIDGVFAQIPMKGVLYWNSHAFNLTDQDTVMHARLNYYFANDDRFPVQGIFDTSKIFSASAAPYTTQTLCNDYPLPQGARLFALSSHTHKHGKHFTVTSGDGMIYESFVYNDPVSRIYDPPLVFDSPDPTQRTLHYCSLYNNGLNSDGSPDPDLVTRYSRIPPSARNSIGSCTPSACAAGKIGERCRGVGDDRSCDSSPGANDGSCDACRITGGESTENEMFILIGSYYLQPGVTAADSATVSAALQTDPSGHSLSTEVALPPQLGCGTAHTGHAAHMAH